MLEESPGGVSRMLEESPGGVSRMLVDNSPNHTSLWKEAGCGLCSDPAPVGMVRVQPGAARPLTGRKREYLACELGLSNRSDSRG